MFPISRVTCNLYNFNKSCILIYMLQLKSIVKNQTGIEMWIVEKALYRRMHYPDLDDFVYPYDLGWWNNIKQVFNNDCVAKGAGIEWPVIDGCNQYTLTVSFVDCIHYP